MKVAIIGGGIVGLFLAWKLAEKGESVTVFEKKTKIGKETCSGLFSERILDFIPQSKSLIQHQINSVLIHFPKKTVRSKFSKKFFVMNHAKLDRLAAGLAKKAGAKIVLSHAFRERDMATHSVLPTRPSGSPHPNPFVCSHIAFSSRFDRVIGCDGANSQVRKFLKMAEPEYRLGILGFILKKDTADLVETWPVSHGFIWKIPRGKEIEYGIIAKPGEARKIFDGFLKKNKIKIRGVSSALIPQGMRLPQNQSITLCGDAAGLTKPWSGGGVIWGLTAAQMLFTNFPNFLKYRIAMRKFFWPQIIFSKMAAKMVYFLGFKIPCLLPKNIKIEGDFLF